MNVRDFLTLAKALANETTEVAWRSAVSRAYYGAFHVARDLLEDLGFTVPKAERAHAFLWLRLSNCGHAHVQLAGQQLNDLRRDRNRADYDVARPLPQAAAAGQIRLTEKVMQLLDTARVEPARTTITDAMKIYERDVLKELAGNRDGLLTIWWDCALQG